MAQGDSKTVNPLIQPLLGFVGRWESKDGKGYFPTIKDFGYNDTIEFQLKGMQPLLSYSAYSSHPEKGNPMHLETGFLRARKNSDSSTTEVSLMVAHNFGLTSLEEGIVMDGEIKMKSTSIGRMMDSKDPSVLEMKRVWKLENENTLTCRFWMATSTNKELTEHLFATYKKIA